MLLDVSRLIALVVFVAWLARVVSGGERFRDKRGRLRPGWAALVAVATLVAVGWALTVFA